MDSIICAVIDILSLSILIIICFMKFLLSSKHEFNFDNDKYINILSVMMIHLLKNSVII